MADQQAHIREARKHAALTVECLAPSRLRDDDKLSAQDLSDALVAARAVASQIIEAQIARKLDITRG